MIKQGKLRHGRLRAKRPFRRDEIAQETVWGEMQTLRPLSGGSQKVLRPFHYHTQLFQILHAQTARPTGA